MKKLLKILALVVGIILILLILAPFLFKKQIVEQIKKEANKQLTAEVNFDNDLSLSFLRNFPNASLGVKDLSITGTGAYQGDTLAYAKDLHIVIDLTSLFGDTYRIRNVSLDQPFIQLLVDSSGRANWDIMKEDTTTGQADTTSSFKAALQQYGIQDGRLIYSDASNGFYLRADGLDHRGKGDFTQDVFDLHTTSHARALTIAYGGIPYLNGVETDVDADININVPESKYSFEKNTIKLNGLTLGVDGYVAMADTSEIKMDLSFQAAQAEFKNFLSLIPAIYQKDFDDLKASGKVAFNGFVKGVYRENHIPAFGLTLNVDNGMFRYPSVPEPLMDVNLAVAVKNDDGNLDHTLINVNRLHFVLGQNPFDAHLTLQHPRSDPLVDGAVKGRLNLSDVSKIYPLEKGTTLGGLLDIDVQAKGRLSAVEQKKYSQFDASGQIKAHDIAYRSSSLNKDIHVPGGMLSFSPQQVKVSDLTATIGKSDIAAAGGLDNFFGYLFGKDKLKGSLNVTSKLLDLNEMMGLDTTATTDTTSGVKAVIIPKNIDFNLQTHIGRFIYDHYDLRNVQGNITVSGGILTIHGISTDLLDGSARLSGTYNTEDPEVPKTDMDFKVEHIDIQKAFKTFVTVKALAPVAAFVQGNFSGDINLSTLLSDKLYPKLTTVNSIGNITIPNLNVKGFAPLQQVASKLDIASLKNLDIHKLLLHFKVDSGFLMVNPFEFAVDGIKMNVSGKNGLNKVIDYTIHMNIPREKLGNASNELTSLIAQANKATGGSLDVGEVVPVSLRLGGTITNPQITLDLSEEKSLIENALRAEAKNQLTQGASQLLDKLTKKDSVGPAADSGAKKPAPKEEVKQVLQKGLNSLFRKKKDTGGK